MIWQRAGLVVSAKAADGLAVIGVDDHHARAGSSDARHESLDRAREHGTAAKVQKLLGLIGRSHARAAPGGDDQSGDGKASHMLSLHHVLSGHGSGPVNPA
jgi:hypothetical protein